MATQTLTIYRTCKVASCTSYPVDAVLCVPSVRTASGNPFIDATLTAINCSGNCGCTCPSNSYEFEYDDAQLLDPDEELTSAEVSNFFCKDCFTAWIEALIEAATS